MYIQRLGKKYLYLLISYTRCTYFFSEVTSISAVSCLKSPIHDATCNMQLAACNKIASCVLEMLRVACSVKLLQANRIVVYSLQHVARSFNGFAGNAATEHLSRCGDLHTLIEKHRDFTAWQV